MTVTVYGIKNCDTMKRAFSWFEAEGLAYQFHDYKRAGIDMNTLRRWARQVGWETLINTRGTTWRGLPEEEREELHEAKALALMAAHPSLIKRPVIEQDGQVWVGFTPERWAAGLKK